MAGAWNKCCIHMGVDHRKHKESQDNYDNLLVLEPLAIFLKLHRFCDIINSFLVFKFAFVNISARYQLHHLTTDYIHIISYLQIMIPDCIHINI